MYTVYLGYIEAQDGYFHLIYSKSDINEDILLKFDHPTNISNISEVYCIHTSAKPLSRSLVTKISTFKS